MGDRSEPRATPRVDLDDAAGESAARPATPDAAVAAPAPRSIRLVLRPAAGWRALGPLLIAAGAAAGVLVTPVAAVVAVAGILLLPLFVVRVECDGTTIRRRRVLRWEEPVAVDDLIALRLRRAPFSALAGWRHSFRFGHYCTVPLRLRLNTKRGVALDLTVVWWSGWIALARFVRSRPGIEVDSRSAARLERF
jgi:hypothetical protein